MRTESKKAPGILINRIILYGTFGNCYCHYCGGQGTGYMVFLNSRTKSNELLPYEEVNHIALYLSYLKTHRLLLRLSPYCIDKR